VPASSLLPDGKRLSAAMDGRAPEGTRTYRAAVRRRLPDVAGVLYLGLSNR